MRGLAMLALAGTLSLAGGHALAIPMERAILQAVDKSTARESRNVGQCGENGTCGSLTLEAEAKGKAWARTLRDPIERCLGTEQDPLDLSFIPDDVLVHELQSRGWKVDKS